MVFQVETLVNIIHFRQVGKLVEDKHESISVFGNGFGARDTCFKNVFMSGLQVYRFFHNPCVWGLTLRKGFKVRARDEPAAKNHGANANPQCTPEKGLRGRILPEGPQCGSEPGGASCKGDGGDSFPEQRSVLS